MVKFSRKNKTINGGIKMPKNDNTGPPKDAKGPKDGRGKGKMNGKGKGQQTGGQRNTK